jgi:hypothetical protein
MRIQATQNSGQITDLVATNEGHLEIEIHGPRLPFGSIHVENAYPVFQIDAVYGINDSQVRTTTSGSGGATGTSNLFTASTGTTIYSFGTVQSRKRLRYRPGQGSLCRFTALFSEPVANSIVVAGVGSGESGLFFGYNGTSFGILHSTGGVREIQTLTVTTASTSTQPYNITLNGTATNVTATNNSSTARTAYEISQGTYSGWTAQAVGSTVVFLANDVGNKAGAFSIAQSGAGSPAAGTFAETRAGVAATDTWVPQSDWNGDPINGTKGNFAIDPQKGNVFQIGMQYLGFGVITFQVLTTNTNSNNPTWTTVHTLKFPNTRTSTNVSQPSYPFTMAAYSAGSTTDVSVSCASMAGFVEGQKVTQGPRQTYFGTSTAVSTTSYFAIKTIRNDLVFKGRANQSVVNLLSFAGAHDDATPVTLFLIRNATLVGNPNFVAHSTGSCTSVDSAATTCTFSNNEQVILSIPIGDAGNETINLPDDVTIQPGESITIAAQAVTGTATYTIFSLNTREDQ